MGFLNCPQCGSQNRDSDLMCFSCGADLTSVEPPPPPPPSPSEQAAAEGWAENLDVRVQPVSPGKGSDPNAGRFRDLASRYEAKPVVNLEANLVHGLRAALPVGLIMGAAYAGYHKVGKTELTRWVQKKHPKTPLHGGEMLGYAFGYDLFLAVVIGVALGLSNLLCYVPEAGRTGAILGVLASGVLIFLTQASYVGLVIGGINGFLIGTLASLVERKLFRRI